MVPQCQVNWRWVIKISWGDNSELLAEEDIAWFNKQFWVSHELDQHLHKISEYQEGWQYLEELWESLIGDDITSTQWIKQKAEREVEVADQEKNYDIKVTQAPEEVAFCGGSILQILCRNI